MKVKDRVCDVCGESIYRHAAHTYKIVKRFPETEFMGQRIDLCERCYKRLERWIRTHNEGDTNDD